MHRTVIAFALILALGIVTTATAAKPDDGCTEGLTWGTQPGGTLPEGRTDFVDAWNVNGEYNDALAYDQYCYAVTYHPSVSYWLNRIEFVAGEAAGTAYVDVLVDDGSGAPNGTLLGSSSFVQDETVAWRGANFAPCIYVEQGTTYYIHYRPVYMGQASSSISGTTIQHYWSDDCATWHGAYTTQQWMVKFFGAFMPSATETSTWGAIKILYR